MPSPDVADCPCPSVTLTPDEEAILRQLIEQLQQSLTQEIADRLAAIQQLNGLITQCGEGVEGLESQIDALGIQITQTGDTLTQRVVDAEASFADLQASFNQLQLVSVNGDTALSQQITALTATVGDNFSSLTQRIDTVTDNDSTRAQDITVLQSRFNGWDAALTQLASTVANGDGASAQLIENLQNSFNDLQTSFTREVTLRINAEQRLSESLTSLKVTVNGLDIVTVNERLTALEDNVNGSVAAAVTALSVTLNGQISTLTQSLSLHASRLGVIEAEWNVKADINGRISGLSLIAGADITRFEVLADSFKITTPTTPAGAGTQIFTVDSRGVKATAARFTGKLEAGELGTNSLLYNATLNGSGQLLYPGNYFPSKIIQSTPWGNQSNGRFKLGYADNTGALNTFRDGSGALLRANIHANVYLFGTFLGIGYGSGFNSFRLGKAGNNLFVVRASGTARTPISVWWKLHSATDWKLFAAMGWSAPASGETWHSVSEFAQQTLFVTDTDQIDFGINSLYGDATAFDNATDANNDIWKPVVMIEIVNY